MGVSSELAHREQLQPRVYETDGGSNPVRIHTFAAAGKRTVRVMVVDDRGAWTIKALVVNLS